MAFGVRRSSLVLGVGALASGLLALEGTLCLFSADLGEVLTIPGGQVAVLRSPYSVDRRASPVQRRIRPVETSGLFALFGFSVSLLGRSIPPFGREIPLKSPGVYGRRSLVSFGLVPVGERFALIGDAIPLVRYLIAFIGSAVSLVSQDIPSVCYHRTFGHLVVTAAHTCHVMPGVFDF